MFGPAPIRVVLLETRPLFAVGLQETLRREPGFEVVATLHSVDAAVKALPALKPDVVLADLPLPPQAARHAILQMRRVVSCGMVAIGRAIPGAGATTTSAVSIETDDAIHIDDARTSVQLITVLRRAARHDWPTPAASTGTTAAPPAREEPAGPDALAARAVAELREAMLADPAAGFHLTPRELDILGLVARGMRNREIARILGLSEQTVKNHLTAVTHKTGVRNRHDAVVYARRQGWLPEMDPADEPAGARRR